jgi:hypothetical protein
VGARQESDVTELPVVRVSIFRCARDAFPRLRDELRASEAVLAEGIRAMRGGIDFFAGADEATSSFTNVSVWETLEDARQLDGFGPMLELGRRFTAMGATFERPIMNYATLWRL